MGTPRVRTFFNMASTPWDTKVPQYEEIFTAKQVVHLSFEHVMHLKVKGSLSLGAGLLAHSRRLNLAPQTMKLLEDQERSPAPLPLPWRRASLDSAPWMRRRAFLPPTSATQAHLSSEFYFQLIFQTVCMWMRVSHRQAGHPGVLSNKPVPLATPYVCTSMDATHRLSLWHRSKEGKAKGTSGQEMIQVPSLKELQALYFLRDSSVQACVLLRRWRLRKQGEMNHHFPVLCGQCLGWASWLKGLLLGLNNPH